MLAARNKKSKTNLNDWIRQEHDKVEQLADKLHKKVAYVPRANLNSWLEEVRERFEHLRAHLIRHMALEEEGGYMSAVLERRPTLADRIDRLEREHAELGRLLDDIHVAIGTIRAEDRLLIRDISHRMKSVLDYVEHHEKEENDLVQLVFTDDIGTKD